MPQNLFRMTLVALIAMVLAFPAAAQSLTGLGMLSGDSSETEENTETQGESDLAAAIRQAAESGVNVIVMDGNGRVLSAESASATPETTETGSEQMEHGSRLMQTQSEIRDFSLALETRLAALPVSINEVLFILRATSPDGKIWTYVEVLMWSLLFLAAGMLFERQVFGKQVVQRFVLARIAQAPIGYREKLPYLLFRFLMAIVGVMVSVIVAFLLGLLVHGSPNDKSVLFTVTAIYAAYAVCRVAIELWCMVLSPHLTQYRIPTFTNSDALKLFPLAKYSGSSGHFVDHA